VAFALTAIFRRVNKHRLVVTAADGEVFLLQKVSPTAPI
jgi:hypothetical protein